MPVNRRTDGISSCFGNAGLDRNDVRLAVNALTESVMNFAGEAPQSDDITLLALQYGKDASSRDDLEFHFSIGNRLDEINAVIESFEAFSDNSGIPTPVTMKINIALDDLLHNIVAYAFPEGGEHEIDIRAVKSPGRVVLTVEDCGQPFDPFARPEVDTSLPLEDREIGGLGIHLVKNIMDEASYERRGDRNIVTLVKNLED